MIDNACPARQDLTDFALGKLPEDISETIASHISSCLACQDTLRAHDDATDPLIASLRAPLVEDPYMQESGCREAIALVEAIGREPSINAKPASAAHLASPPDLGDVGQYRLLAKLGEGGMGTVYKALHTRLEKVVALKVLPRDRTQDSRAVARFAREMKAVGRLEHAHLVRAMDANEQDGTHYLVMEYVDGCDLGDLVHRHGPLAIADACELIRQAAVGLQYAHENGLVHRDIKPSNLMLTRQGQVKILDLGLALLRADESIGREMTGEGQMMGTADYIAPEQATDAHSVDIRADIYSLGCTLYKLLTGQAPFAGAPHKKPLEVILAHLQQPIPSVRGLRPEVPEELASILARMTAKCPAERFASPAEVAAALEPLASRCDLVRLVSDVGQPGTKFTSVEPSLTNTDDYVSSAMTGTKPSQPAPVVNAVDQVSPLASVIRGEGLGVRGGSRRSWLALTVAAAVLLAMLGGGIYFGIIVRINNPDGTEQEIRLSEASQVSVEKDGKEVFRHPSPKAGKTAKETPNVPIALGTVITPQPLPPLAGGEPLSSMALVARPAEISGVRSWTIETRGHRGYLTALVYSPDGRWLAAVGEDCSIRLWEPGTGRCARALVGHDSRLGYRASLALAWSPDSKTLASLAYDGNARLWDAESGRVLRAWAAFKPDWERTQRPAVAWSPDGTLLATAGQEGQNSAPVRVWDVRSGQLVRETKSVSPILCWSPNAKELATVTGKQVQVWEATSGQPLRTLAVPKSYLDALAWSADGKRLAGVGPGFACCWDAESGQILRMRDVSASQRMMVIWSPDCETVAFNPGEVTLWDPTSDTVRSIAKSRQLYAVAWSPDGKTIATGGDGGSVQFWSASSGELLQSVNGHAPLGHNHFARAPAAWSPDSKTLAGKTWRWETASGTLLNKLNDWDKHGNNFAWSPDGKVLARAGGDVLVELLDPASQQRLRALEGEEDPGESLIWSSDSKIIAGTYKRSTICLWDTGSGQTLRTLHDPAEVKTLALSPDSATLASSNARDTLLLWDVASGNLRSTLKLPYFNAVSAMAWGPDGKIIAAGCGGNVLLFDAATGELLDTLRNSPSRVLSLAWSQDGKTLVAGSQDGKTRLWDAATGRMLRELNMPPGFVSPDRRLVAARSVNTLSLWEIATGRPLTTMVALQGGHLLIAADGHYRGSPRVERELVYVVETEAGQETLTPEEFSAKYGWKNDPAKVSLTAELGNQQHADSGHADQQSPVP